MPKDTAKPTVISRTSWSSSEAATLVATLAKEKLEGRQAESGFKAISYKTAVEDQLRVHGKVKTVKQCQDHWKKVGNSTVVLCSGLYDTFPLLPAQR
jgi:hypothetical protein